MKFIWKAIMRVFHEPVHRIVERVGVGCILKNTNTGLMWEVGTPDWSGYIAFPYPPDRLRKMEVIPYNSKDYELV